MEIQKDGGEKDVQRKTRKLILKLGGESEWASFCS